MKVFVYGFREEERVYFEECAKRYGIAYAACSKRPTLENAHLACGYPCISILSTPCDAALIESFRRKGVRFISTRTIGYDHIDLAAAKKVGMGIGNANYAPESVADYTIMLILMTLRKMKLIMKSTELQDYSFESVQGRNLKGKIVGVIGCGNIGTTLIRHLAGFECDILAYNRHIKPELLPYAQFCDLATLLKKSDIITLHLPLHEETYHIINQERIAMMKDGVILINTARGALIDNEALIKGIEKGKIQGAAFDVVEGETGIYYQKQKGRVLPSREMLLLNSYPNVILSPHMAFLTDDSNRDMVYHSMESCLAFMEGEEDAMRIL